MRSESFKWKNSEARGSEMCILGVEQYEPLNQKIDSRSHYVFKDPSVPHCSPGAEFQSSPSIIDFLCLQ